MSGHDIHEDGFPHGTPDGYAGGCRGGACPAGAEHGLSCRLAKQKASGDYQYQKLAKAGASPAAIAEALGLHPEVHRAAPKKVAVPDDEFEIDEPEEAPMEAVKVPTPKDVAPKPKPVQKPTPAPTPKPKPKAAPKPKRKTQDGPSQSEMRAWARENGLDVNPRGQVRSDVVRAYLAAHAPILSKVADVSFPEPEIPPMNIGMRREFTGPDKQAPVTLAEFADVPCENLTQGSCADEGSGRSPVSPYGATGYCWPCRIRHALRFDEVLVEGSWFKRAELPTILGNYMRTAEDFARQVKDITIAGAELAPAPEADAAAYAALELVLRKWAAEKDRADALQRALDDERERLGSFARMLSSYQEAATADGEHIASLDEQIRDLTDKVALLSIPWWQRRAS